MWSRHTDWKDLIRKLDNLGVKKGLQKKIQRAARLLQIEEMQRSDDVKAYDVYNRTFIKQENRMFKDVSKYHKYLLEVPGILDGTPRITVGDIIRVSVTEGWTNQFSCVRPNTELAFRVIAIVSKTQTIYLDSPFPHSLHVEPSFRGHALFAYDENFFSRCRIALSHFQRLEILLHHSDSGSSARGAVYHLPKQNILELNDEQYEFLKKIFRGENALIKNHQRTINERRYQRYCNFLIGPPGSGKPLTIANAVLATLYNKSNARIIVCAPAPYAADVVLDRILSIYSKYASSTYDIPDPGIFCRIDDLRRGAD